MFRQLISGAVFACVCLFPVAVMGIQTNTGWQQLGQRLFTDFSLSLDGQIACTSCHLTAYAMADQRSRPTGRNNVLITRNAPSLLGLRLHQPLFWDGRRDDLMQAVLDPLFSPHEHALSGPDELLGKVLANSEYRASFVGLLSEGIAVESQHIAQAIVAYLQSLPSATSPYDQWQATPDDVSIGADAKLGYQLFTGRAGCARCHRIDDVPASFTDDQFHAHGVGTVYLDDLCELLQLVANMDEITLRAATQIDLQVAALGRYLVTELPNDIGKFRTPSLRNVMRTAPYMHDGSIDSIDAVVARELYYSAADQGANFSLEERRAIVAFLQLLNDEPVLSHALNNDLYFSDRKTP